MGTYSLELTEDGRAALEQLLKVQKYRSDELESIYQRIQLLEVVVPETPKPVRKPAAKKA